jgi:hypothetical protein
MSIEKKSLLSTLKTTKKVNVASPAASNDGSTSRKMKVAKSFAIRNKAARYAAAKRWE